MKIRLYVGTTSTHLGAFYLYYPVNSSCTVFIANCAKFPYFYSCLSDGTYTYFDPDTDGSYITTLEINSPDDFYNYPELFI